MVDPVGGQLSVGERLLDARDRPFDEVRGHRLERLPAEVLPDMLRAGAVGGDERQVDLRLRGEGQLPLGFLRGLLHPLESELVRAEIDLRLRPEARREPFEDAVVEVLAAEVGIPVRGQDVEDAVAELEDGDVERPAAEVIDGGQAVCLGVEPVGQPGRGRLVDDALDVEPADRGRVLGRLSLGVVEMGRHRDDRLRHGLAEKGFGAGLEVAQDHRGDLGRAQTFIAQKDGDVAVGGLSQLVGQSVQGLLDLR